MEETIHILHTNDIHSHLANWPRIKNFLLTKKQQYLQQGDVVLLFDDGDMIDRVHPLTEATMGQANIKLMNTIGYTAATIGNNEGIGLSHHNLMHLYDQANFPIILANLFDKKTQQRPVFAQPYRIITTDTGTRIALIGMTAPYPRAYQPNGWQTTDVDQTLPSLLMTLQGKYDLLIMLSHLGIDDDRYIAQHYPQINLIIGGHTHHLFRNGEMVNHTLLTAAEKYGHYVGEVTITMNNHQINTMRAQTHIITALPVVANEQALTTNWQQQGQQLLAQHIVAKLPYSLDMDWHAEHPMINTALAALRWYGHSDAAILNSGLFLRSLSVGNVTYADIHAQLPHAMHLINVKLRGIDLWRLVMEMEKNRRFLRRYPMKGMGFRGKIFGEIIYSGLRVNMDTKTVYWHEQPLDMSCIYQFTTVDNFAFIPYFPTIEIMSEITILFPDFLREVVAQYLTQQYPPLS
ncbi:MAG: metallophosphoesterase [Candidatus Paralactobacillus gallistercoris]|uniref:Metallophosphoesterase n=1 Tax=Candidatus Paralactobacillus gallistercoris TaxID=2838724 RepID=A0A948TK64_9LACO|nr:metallophosphoesterase [Candidatus Paralactobacillus gallistercoris]